VAVPDFEKTPPDVRDLLGKRISQLGLRLEGSPVERFVHQLHRELNSRSLLRSNRSATSPMSGGARTVSRSSAFPSTSPIPSSRGSNAR
jgi:hypothetical protein